VSIPIDTVLALLEAHTYLLLFPLVLLEGPISTAAAGLLMLGGYFAGEQVLALAGRLAPGPLASLVLLALVPITYLLLTKRVLFRGPKDATQNARHNATQTFS
jgi:hypothetical protein